MLPSHPAADRSVPNSTFSTARAQHMGRPPATRAAAPPPLGVSCARAPASAARTWPAPRLPPRAPPPCGPPAWWSAAGCCAPAAPAWHLRQVRQVGACSSACERVHVTSAVLYVCRACCSGPYDTACLFVNQRCYVKDMLQQLGCIGNTACSAHLHLCTPSPLHTFTCTPSHVHLCTPSPAHLHTFTSAHLHLHTFTPSPLHTFTCTPSHLHLQIITRMCGMRVTPGALRPPPPVLLPAARSATSSRLPVMLLSSCASSSGPDACTTTLSLLAASRSVMLLLPTVCRHSTACAWVGVLGAAHLHHVMPAAQVLAAAAAQLLLWGEAAGWPGRTGQDVVPPWLGAC